MTDTDSLSIRTELDAIVEALQRDKRKRVRKLLRGMHPSVIILAAALAGDDLGRFTAGARRYGGVEQPMIVLLPSDAAAMSASALDGFQAQLHRPVTREALCAAVGGVGTPLSA